MFEFKKRNTPRLMNLHGLLNPTITVNNRQYKVNEIALSLLAGSFRRQVKYNNDNKLINKRGR